MYILTRAANGTVAGAFDTLQHGEIWLLIGMIAIADAGYFFACILFSSQGLTLITALMIPLGYGFEMLALDGEFNLVPAISGLCIGLGVIQKVRIHEADNAEKPAPKAEAQKDDKTAGQGGKVDEGKEDKEDKEDSRTKQQDKEAEKPTTQPNSEGLELQEGEANIGSC